MPDFGWSYPAGCSEVPGDNEPDPYEFVKTLNDEQVSLLFHFISDNLSTDMLLEAVDEELFHRNKNAK